MITVLLMHVKCQVSLSATAQTNVFSSPGLAQAPDCEYAPVMTFYLILQQSLTIAWQHEQQCHRKA